MMGIVAGLLSLASGGLAFAGAVSDGFSVGAAAKGAGLLSGLAATGAGLLSGLAASVDLLAVGCTAAAAGASCGLLATVGCGAGVASTGAATKAVFFVECLSLPLAPNRVCGNVTAACAGRGLVATLSSSAKGSSISGETARPRDSSRLPTITPRTKSMQATRA